MRFNQEYWFQELNLELQKLNNNIYLSTYLISIGPLKIQVIFPKDSSFNKAINSFHTIQKLEQYIPNLHTIYCLDENFVDNLPPINITNNDIGLNNFKARLSTQSKIINYDESRNIYKIINTHDKKYLLLCKDFDAIASWEIYSPLKEFIHFIAIESNCWLCHAGSLCKNNKAIILFGSGGNGKSTTTMTGLSRGLQTVGDDYVLVENLNDKFYAHAIYKTVKTYPSKLFKLHNNFAAFERHIIEKTGKYVYICDEDKGSSFFTNSAEIIMNIGLRLKKAVSASETTPLDFNARYLSLSSIEQIPFWINKSSRFSEKMFESIPSHFLDFNEGKSSLNDNISYILQRIS